MDRLYTLHVLSELHFNCTLKTSLWVSIWSLYITLYSNEFTLSNLYTRLFILPNYTSRISCTGGRGELLTSLLPDQLYRGEGAHDISPSRPAVQEGSGELLISLIPDQLYRGGGGTSLLPDQLYRGVRGLMTSHRYHIYLKSTNIYICK